MAPTSCAMEFPATNRDVRRSAVGDVSIQPRMVPFSERPKSIVRSTIQGYREVARAIYEPETLYSFVRQVGNLPPIVNRPAAANRTSDPFRSRLLDMYSTSATPPQPETPQTRKHKDHHARPPPGPALLPHKPRIPRDRHRTPGPR